MFLEPLKYSWLFEPFRFSNKFLSENFLKFRFGPLSKKKKSKCFLEKFVEFQSGKNFLWEGIPCFEEFEERNILTKRYIQNKLCDTKYRINSKKDQAKQLPIKISLISILFYEPIDSKSKFEKKWLNKFNGEK